VRERPLISVVIPCYNEAKVLGRTLAHLLPHCATSRLELVVSDDGSDDESLEVARRAGCLVAASDGSPRSASRARNRGARVSSGEILVFIDADILVDDPPFFFEELRRRFGRPGLLGATVCCMVYPGEASFWDDAYHHLYNEFTWLCNGLGFGTAGGWCQVVRREAFFELDGYDPRFTSGQDVDLFLRLSRRGKTRLLRNLRILESPRRYRAQGLVRTAVGWLLNGIWVHFLRRPYLKRYPPVR